MSKGLSLWYLRMIMEMNKQRFDSIIAFCRGVNVSSMFVLPIIILILTRNGDIASFGVLSPFIVEFALIRPIEDSYYSKIKKRS